ncbi:MAG: two-component sensor histidine kinase [Dysgonamonadaceae bacterium]|nr:two-component sensor histidine kinase [Dysgonamonadaceae bacterium]
MKLNYRQRLFLYFFIVFSLFTIGVIIFEQEREKNYKTEILESEQSIFVNFVHNYIVQNQISLDSIERVNNILSLLPENLRVTIIKEDGSVVFDNNLDTLKGVANHLDRPEIQIAKLRPFGTNIRKSASVNKEFMYLAKHYDGYFIRVAIPYDIVIKKFFKTDNIFLYFILFLFFASMIAMIYLSGRFSKSISKLRDFASAAQAGNPDLKNITFPEDELGEIGEKIVDVYEQVQENKKKISLEREKMLQHFNSLQEGVSFFTPKRNKIYANSHFIQYLNFLTEKPSLNVNKIFEEPVFKDLQDFLDESQDKSTVFTTQKSRDGKHFNITVVRFEDSSFEIAITNVTKMEKTRLMKQEMTNNIAHELKTPVTSIRGYLETLIKQSEIDSERRQFFLERAYSQIVRLSELIQDISFVTRMEEASDLFEIENVQIQPLLKELKKDLSDKFVENKINFDIKVENNVAIEGNRILLYSIFRNLTDNSITYGGNNLDIQITNYMEDDNYYYFSYYDSGKGIDEKHLARIFERFYRVSEGRTRDTGGSGLGLSIVKNAVLFHKGEIVAKNRSEGGLEFLFTLKKKR